MKRFLVPTTGFMKVDGEELRFWAISYEERVMGSMTRLHFFNHDGGCDGKIMDWMYADAPDFMREIIQKTQAEIKSWSHKGVSRKAKKKGGVDV